jgi:hypothetical protein
MTCIRFDENKKMTMTPDLPNLFKKEKKETKKNNEMFYKIRNRKTGLFATEGCYPSFSKKGKIWRTIGYLKSHLNGIRIADVYKDCEIIEYETYQKSVIDMISFEKDLEKEINDKQKKLYTRQEKEAKENRRKEWLKLNEEFSK